MIKTMKKIIIILILTFIAIPVFAGTGFLLDQIWYSSDTLKEGETVKIYTAIWNENDSSLSAKVEFYDKSVILGTRDVIIQPESLEDISISWKVTSGNHIISAKIISSSLTTGGDIVIKNNSTASSRQFVAVIVKEKDGKSLTSTDIIKDELAKVGEKINNVLPASVSESVSSGTDLIETFRDETLIKILSSKEKTIDKLLQYEGYTKKEGTDTLESATEKPIAQVKLFFLKILEFVFNNKIVFYSSIILIIFFFLRSIYRKIRNR